MSIVDGKLEGGLNFDVFRYAERQSSMFNSQLQRIEANVNQVAAATEEATAGTKEAVKEAEKLPTIVETAQKKYGELKAKIASIQSVCEKVKSVMDFSDQITQSTTRLNMLTGSKKETDQLQSQIMASANRTGTSYLSQVDVISDLGIDAGGVFHSNEEILQFAENLNKEFAICGASQQEMAQNSQQLAQALSDGVMQSEELHSLFGAAPSILQTIADYMGAPVEQIDQLAAAGAVTSDVVKNAMLQATEDINSRFEATPMTWAQVWERACNGLFQVVEPMLSLIGFLADNWSILEPIILGVAAALLVYNAAVGVSSILDMVAASGKTIQQIATTALTTAQQGLNAAFMASPITWIIMGVMMLIAVFYAVVAVINKVTGSSLSATGMIVGALAAAVAFIQNLLIGMANFFIGIYVTIYNYYANLANVLANCFRDPLGAAAHLLAGFCTVALGLLSSLAEAIDGIFGTDFASGVNGWIDNVNDWAKSVENGKYQEEVELLNKEDYYLQYKDYGKAYDKGYNFGSTLFGDDSAGYNPNLGTGYDNIAGYTGSNSDELLGAAKQTAENTDKINDNLAVANEDLKYLRDYAAEKALNRYTVTEIKIDMTNNNTINSEMDMDGFVTSLKGKLEEELYSTAEGVH
ncbi:MAG: tape measure protein [Firmicutes bacterium]|nr:tape measure protein [Bacillota bacterium]